MRRRVPWVVGVALLCAGVAVWLGPRPSTRSHAPPRESHSTGTPGRRWEAALRAPTPPPGGTLRIQGVVRDEQGPAAGVRVSATRPMPGETLSELPCPELPESSVRREPKALKLPDCLAEAEAQVLELVGARHGEAPLYAEALTGADGSFVLEGLPEGSFMLWALSERGAKRQPDVVAGTEGVQLVLDEGLTLEGGVRDEEGRLLPEVRMTFLHEEHTRFFDTRTDKEGRFRVGPLPRDSYALVAEKEGWLPTFLPHGLRELLKGQVVLFRPSRLTGRVLSNGVPAPGAQVRLTSRRRPTFEEQVLAADAKGHFTFEPLGPGDYQLTAASQGLHAVGEAELGVPGEPVEEVVLNLGEARYVEGTVRDTAGRPLEGATVSLRLEDEYGRSWDAVTDAQGRYQVGPVAPGAYAFDISALRYVDVQGEPKLLTRDTGPLDFTLRPAALVEGVLVDEEGKPVPDIRLYLMHPTELPGEFDMPPDWGWSDANGRFSMDAPMAGEWVLDASDERYLPQGVRVQAPVEGLRLVLRGGATVTGTLTDARGTPMERAWVILWEADKAGRSSKAEATDERGRFTLRGIEPGQYVLEATLDHHGVDRTAVKTLEVRGSEPHEVSLRFEEGWTLTGSVVDVEGQPLAGAAVRAELPSEETPAWRRNSRRCGNKETRDARTGPDGRFTVRHLVGEVYEVSAWKEGFTPDPSKAVGCELIGGGALRVSEGNGAVRLVLERQGRVRGRVVGPDGAPLRHFSLNNRPVTDVKGAFEYSFEETGEVLLELTAPGMAPAMRAVQVREGSDVDLGEVRLNEGRRVEGRVVDAETGAPVAEVRIQLSDATTNGGKLFQSEGLLKLTGEDGTFELRQVEARPLTLTVDHYEYREARIPLGAGAEKVTVRLDPGARVEATLQDSQGQPLSGEVSLRSQEGSGWKTIHVRKGRGLRRGIEPGLYLAEARLDDDSGIFLAQKVRIPASGTVTLAVTQGKEGATLKLRVE